MAELSEIKVDADGIPDAGGSNTVPTLKRASEALGSPDDDRSSATDTTSASQTALLKQISYLLDRALNGPGIVIAPDSQVSEDLFLPLDPWFSLDLDETEEEVKADAGSLHWLDVVNTYDGVVYLQIYDALAASVTVGTTTPKLTVPIPKRWGADDPISKALEFPEAGMKFETAITLAVTTTPTGATGPGTGEVIVNALYR